MATLQALERQEMLAVLEGSQHRDACRGKEGVPFKVTSKDVRNSARRRLQQAKTKEKLLTEAHDDDQRVATNVSTLVFGIAKSELT